MLPKYRPNFTEVAHTTKRLGRPGLQCLHRPRNDLRSMTVRGLGNVRMALTFPSLGLTPPRVTVCPKYSTCPSSKLHFYRFNVNLDSLNRSNTCRSLSACSSIVFEKIRISPTNMRQTVVSNPNSTLSITFMKVEGAPVRPNAKHSY
jgi:hypothetical protein